METKEKKPKIKKKAKVKVFTGKKKTGDPEKVVIEKLQAQYENIDTSKVNKFTELPISKKTIKGLQESKYFKLTDIQRESISLALQGKDILGAAQTGSGKTLAFLVPVLEALYCKQWTRLDGLGALVITPTRELAYQIFETLRKVGHHHDISAGLIIGGKDLKFEKKRMDQCNIVICTPGRLLQHMDENPLFDCVNLQVLVLDEADRILDMGFKETMNAIIANLPLKRQTMLFSATQTKSVKDLARLSLKDPSYISVHESVTPKELKQSYVVCELHDKVSILWSFIKNHIKKKSIIFFSTCKQVKFFYEIFCKLRPGVPLMPLYGTLHQLRRMAIYEDFCKKHAAVLFATDLAARGLDFPEVHWVVQADCPEDADTYIHRVGRTARYHRGGESLLLLMPSELKMLEYLEDKKIPVEKIDINPQKLQNPVKKLEAYLAKDIALKETAQRAFSHYARAVCFMKHKEVFNIQDLDLPKFANSIGLTIAPRIRFLERMNKKNSLKETENKPALNKKIIFNDEDDSEIQKDEAENDVKSDKKHLSDDSGVSESESDDFVFKNKEEGQKLDTDSDSDGEDILQMKRSNHEIELPTQEELDANSISQNNKKKPVTKAAMVKKMLKKKIQPNKKIVFDEEGKGSLQGTVEKKSELAMEYEMEDTGGIDIEKAKLVLREEDKFDKQVFKEKVKAKHKEERRKAKLLKQKNKDEENEERDEFGESEDDEGPDMSWLPDPDKIYGEKKFNSDDDNSQHDEEKSDRSTEETSIIVKKKKKVKKLPKRKHEDTETTDHKSTKRKKLKQLKSLSDTLDVNETEELALMLLRNK